MTRYNGSRHLVGISGLVPQHEGHLLHPDKLIRVVVDRQVIDAKFLNYQLESHAVRAFLEPRIRTTAGQSGISGKDVRDIPVALPSLPEQRRIVDILEDHLSRLEAAQSYLDVAQRRSSAWSAGVADDLIWGSGYPSISVAEILREPMRNGRSDRASKDGDGLRTLTLTAVTKNEFTERFTKRTVTNPAAAKDLWLTTGDVLVQRSNTAELVGTAARYQGPDHWAIFPDLLIRLRSDEARLDSRYLTAALRTERTHRALRARAKGLAGSMPKIDQRAVGETLIPCPPIDKQLQALAQIENVESQNSRSQLALSAAQERGRGLRQTILAAAFEGRLTGRSADVDVIEEMAGV